MKLIFIRHGDPDYAKDSLTKKGWIEAELLSERISKLDVKAFYVSPLGRAKDTANVTLKKTGRTATTCDWLKEFIVPVKDPVTGQDRIPWDFMPAYWTNKPELYDNTAWTSSDIMKTGNIAAAYQTVTDGIDSLLKPYGYQRNGRLYTVTSANRDTLVFFCHLGVQFVILSHLLGIPAPVLWHGFFVAPTSVTILQTEERICGEAYFRCRTLGDTAHLYVGGEPVSDSGFFQETYQTQ